MPKRFWVDRFWTDEGGAIVSAELVLVMTILGIGMAVGVMTLRDAVVTELADVAGAVGALNQSYSFAGASAGVAGTDFTQGSSWVDYVDAEDMTDGAMSQGVSVSDPPAAEEP